MKLPKGITINTIFASGTMGENKYMPLKWVLKHGNITQAIVDTKQNIQSAISNNDKEYLSILEKKLIVLELCKK